MSDPRKASGLGRSTPMSAMAIYVADPRPPPKDWFKTLGVDYIVKKIGGFSPTPDQEAFNSKASGRAIA